MPVAAASLSGMESIMSESTTAICGMSCGSTQTNLRSLARSVMT